MSGIKVTRFNRYSYIGWSSRFIKVAGLVLCFLFVGSSQMTQRALAQEERNGPFTILLPFVSTAPSQPTAWQVISAGTAGTACIRDATGKLTGQMCTANDVRISNYELIAGPPSCVAGETINVTLKARIESGPDRYDIGLWVDQGGGNALDSGNVCYRDYLHPTSTDNTNVNLSSGSGPFFNGEIGTGGNDICGDLPAQSA